MSCLYPLNALQSAPGIQPIIIDQSHALLEKDNPHLIKLPCGQCIECRLQRSRNWALRCVHEASLWELNCFITLTYNNESVPHFTECGFTYHTLYKQDFVKFMKHLRKHEGENIRFYMCGEYGEACQNCNLSRRYCRCRTYIPGLGRPHYHAALFNYDFIDKELWKDKKRYRIYTSKFLNHLWPWGYSTIADLNWESAAYIARYITKKILGDKELSERHYKGRLPEYTNMSRGNRNSKLNGIGSKWFELYQNDIYPKDSIHYKGKSLRPARYYDKLYDIDHHDTLLEIRKSRKERGKKNAVNEIAQRRSSRARVAQYRLQQNFRSYEIGE